jgi:hypothetical protein
MADLKLVPHPLVEKVAQKLADDNVGTIQLDAVRLLQKGEPPAEAVTQERYREVSKGASVDDLKLALVQALANQATLPGLSLFAGFVGSLVSHDGITWRLVYLDARLDSWLLVQETDIVAHQRMTDDTSGERDVLWVNATANLVRGSGPRTNDGRFLVGELTRAGDFAASTSGGTFSAATGLLCEATTPGCCVYTRTRC